MLGYPNISHNTTELTVEYPVNTNALLREAFFIVLKFKHNP